MVDRVLLNEGGLKVSRPGFDVKTATIGQLLFSSDYSQLGLYMTASASNDGTVFYGKTFSSIPLVFTRVVWNTGSGRGANLIGGGICQFLSGGGTVESDAIVRVQSDRIVYDRWAGHSYSFYFSVYDFNL